MLSLKKAPVKISEKIQAVNIVGTLAEESKLREYVWRKTVVMSFNSATPKSTPLSFLDFTGYYAIFTNNKNSVYCSIYGDIAERKTEYCGLRGVREQAAQAVCLVCQNDGEPNRLQQLKITHPKIYNYLFDKLNYKEVCIISVLHTDKLEVNANGEQAAKYIMHCRTKSAKVLPITKIGRLFEKCGVAI